MFSPRKKPDAISGNQEIAVGEEGQKLANKRSRMSSWILKKSVSCVQRSRVNRLHTAYGITSSSF